MRLVASCLLLTACAFDPRGVPGVGDDDVLPPGDGGIDAACGGRDLAVDPLNIDRCVIPPTTGDAIFTSLTIDTTEGSLTSNVANVSIALVTQTDGDTQAMVIAADDIMIPAGVTVMVRGNRPLIIVAIHTLTIDGRIDDGATADVSGAGANLACATGSGAAGEIQQDQNNNSGGSGAGGGGFASIGGTGAGVSPFVGPAPTVAGGAIWGTASLSPIVGGCPGGAGGLLGGAGGGAGGGLELVTDDLAIANTAVITVSGGGGGGAESPSAGGGGGGSGGAILIQANTVLISGVITANGGAGGEGRRDTEAGMPGDDGHRARNDAVMPAKGGSGAAGGNGGDGAVLVSAGGNGTAGTGSDQVTAGGGGGGGGVGRIHIAAGTTANLAGSVFSPVPE